MNGFQMGGNPGIRAREGEPCPVCGSLYDRFVPNGTCSPNLGGSSEVAVCVYAYDDDGHAGGAYIHEPATKGDEGGD